MKDVICADCGGFDIEWMYRCFKHGTEFCRGCSCPVCEEGDLDEMDYEFLDEEAFDPYPPHRQPESQEGSR